jgi:hypothetical protein
VGDRGGGRQVVGLLGEQILAMGNTGGARLVGPVRGYVFGRVAVHGSGGERDSGVW